MDSLVGPYCKGARVLAGLLGCWSVRGALITVAGVAGKCGRWCEVVWVVVGVLGVLSVVTEGASVR